MVRRFGRLAGVTAALTAAVVLAGCTDSGFHYVKSSESKTYFKVPKQWTLFDEDAVLDVLGRDLTETERENELDRSWRVAFDAAPKPSIDHLGLATAEYPTGMAVVRTLEFEVADIISNQGLRNYFFDVDTAIQQGTGEIVDYEELRLDGGFRGIHLVATIDVGGRRMTVDQTMLLDQATTKLYALLVSCSSTCYDDNRGDIESVVDSWTVREK